MPYKKLLSSAFALSLLFGAAACGDDDDTGDVDTEDISPELDDNGGEDGINTEDISPELDEGSGEDGLTDEDMSESEGDDMVDAGE